MKALAGTAREFRLKLSLRFFLGLFGINNYLLAALGWELRYQFTTGSGKGIKDLLIISVGNSKKRSLAFSGSFLVNWQGKGEVTGAFACYFCIHGTAILFN